MGVFAPHIFEWFPRPTGLPRPPKSAISDALQRRSLSTETPSSHWGAKHATGRKVRLPPYKARGSDPAGLALPYRCKKNGAIDVTKPYRFMRFGAMDVTKPYQFIGFRAPQEPVKPDPVSDPGLGLSPAPAPHVTKPHEFMSLGPWMSPNLMNS
jgi:hypothetical protein